MRPAAHGRGSCGPDPSESRRPHLGWAVQSQHHRLEIPELSEQLKARCPNAATDLFAVCFKMVLNILQVLCDLTTDFA